MMRRQSLWSRALLALAVLGVLAAGFAACGGGSGGAGPAPVPTTLTISPNGGTLNAVGATLQLAATVKDQNGQPIASPTVTWSSLATSVAAVSTTGLVAAVANGTAQIQAARLRLLSAFEKRLRLLKQTHALAAWLSEPGRADVPDPDVLLPEIARMERLKASVFDRWQTAEDLEDLAARDYPLTTADLDQIGPHHRPPVPRNETAGSAGCT